MAPSRAAAGSARGPCPAASCSTCTSDAQGWRRSTCYAAPGAPVVVLTGLAEESAGLAAVAAGAQDYLIKGQAPPDVFGRSIRYATQRKHVEQASAALQRSALRAEENARLERALLPTPLIRTRAFDMVARYRPGRANALLGGDFYDVVETPDGIVHAVIGDVCGHGAAEAAVGVCLRVAWRSLVLAGAAPAALMGLLEQMLMAEREGRSPVRHPHPPGLRPGQRSVRVLRAGHPGLLLRTPGTWTWSRGAGRWAWSPVRPGRSRKCRCPRPPAWCCSPTGCSKAGGGRGRQRLGEEGLLAMARGLAMLPPGGFRGYAAGHGRGRRRPLWRARRRRRHRASRLEGTSERIRGAGRRRRQPHRPGLVPAGLHRAGAAGRGGRPRGGGADRADPASPTR